MNAVIGQAPDEDAVRVISAYLEVIVPGQWRSTGELHAVCEAVCGYPIERREITAALRYLRDGARRLDFRITEIAPDVMRNEWARRGSPGGRRGRASPASQRRAKGREG